MACFGKEDEKLTDYKIMQEIHAKLDSYETYDFEILEISPTDNRELFQDKFLRGLSCSKKYDFTSKVYATQITERIIDIISMYRHKVIFLRYVNEEGVAVLYEIWHGSI